MEQAVPLSGRLIPSGSDSCSQGGGGGLASQQGSLEIMRGGGWGGAEIPEMPGSQESSYLCLLDFRINSIILGLGFLRELDGFEGFFCCTIESKVGAIQEYGSQGLGLTGDICREGCT